MLVYGEITQETAKEAVKSLKKGEEVRINSYGGDVFAGMTIAQKVREKGCTAYVDGIAASAAAVIAVCAKKRVMDKGALLMLHSSLVPQTGGHSQELEKAAALLKDIDIRLADLVAECTGIEDAEKYFDGEDHWFSAEDALKEGLIDEIASAATEAKDEYGRAVARIAAMLTTFDTNETHTKPMEQEQTIQDRLGTFKSVAPFAQCETEEEVMQKIASMEIAAVRLEEANESIKRLEEKIAEFEQKEREAFAEKVERALNSLVASRKIMPDAKDAARVILTSDYENGMKVLASVPSFKIVDVEPSEAAPEEVKTARQLFREQIAALRSKG